MSNSVSNTAQLGAGEAYVTDAGAAQYSYPPNSGLYAGNPYAQDPYAPPGYADPMSAWNTAMMFQNCPNSQPYANPFLPPNPSFYANYPGLAGPSYPDPYGMMNPAACIAPVSTNPAKSSRKKSNAWCGWC